MSLRAILGAHNPHMALTPNLGVKMRQTGVHEQ